MAIKFKKKVKKKYQEGTEEAESDFTFGKEPGVGRAVGKVLSGFADDKGKGYSISTKGIGENLAKLAIAPISMLSSCTVDQRVGYHPQKNPNKRPSGKAGCKGPKDRTYINSIRR